MCNRSVQAILKHDRKGTMRFAALQSDFGQAALERHPELKGLDSVVLLEEAGANGDEYAFSRSTAALKVMSYLGGIWKLFLVGYILPGPVRDALYNFIARNRYQVFGEHDTCLLPSPETRARFLDVG